MNWNDTIWDFSKVQTGGLPKLKNLDPNEVTSTVDKYTISTAEEFEKLLNEHIDGVFSIEADIDLSKLNLNNKNSIIVGEFMGKIEGNNHTLTGNTLPLFETLKYARISDLKIEKTTIYSQEKYIGALSKKASYAEIENVHVKNAKISGTDKGGILIGYITDNSIIKESSASGNINMTGSSIGGLVGEVANSSKIENSYSIGTVKANAKVGGLVGLLSNSSITKCFTSVSANGESETAGFIGKSTDNAIVENNISLGNQYNQYKFDGATINKDLSNYKGNYEYNENSGISTLDRNDVNLDGKINVAMKNDITNIEFYKNTLGWNTEIWNLDNIQNGKLPKLNNLDPNGGISIIVKDSINSEDEFIEKLSTRPDGEYTISKDLDFSNKKYKVGSTLIPGIFFGKIEGNGHTIKNLSNATIFEQFNGEVQNLNMDNFQHGVVWNKPPYEQYIDTFNSDKTQNNVSAFTKKSCEAKFYNMKFNRIMVIGNNNIAVVTTNDKNSTFERINVTKALVFTDRNANQGNNASTFISEKTGGSIKNCYVQGEMHIYYGSNNGAIIGLSHGEMTIENVVSNVIGRAMIPETAKLGGLFIGKIDGKTIINNSVSIGKTLNNTLINKFATITNEANIEFITNCYENGDENGISNSNNKNIKEVTKNELLDKEFYKNILKFDESVWNLENIQEKVYSESPYPHSSDPTRFPVIIDFKGLR